MVNIEINGIPVQARDGAMVIEAADEAGITIPRFCYHKKLSVAANCRMCLVEVERVAKPLPACATPVTDGMRVFTRSPKAIAAQRGVMEFLLINHPLDCPICDQGGECTLQEMAMGYGKDASRYQEDKRVVADQDIGPLIATEMTRCIHCTRCVRFGQEIAGIMELGAVGRGEHTRIGTFMEMSVDSELSGNVIDLCPVGALTSKPYRYTARPWELNAHDGISPHDCVGANLRVDTRGRQVMRVVARENEAVNETWIADRDRFSYLGLQHPERLKAPMIKQDGEWREADWDTALTHAAEGLKRIADGDGADRIGALGAYWATAEELYLLQKLMRGIGSGNVDHRLRQQDFRDQDAAPPFPWLGQSISELEGLDAVLLVGSNVGKEQPLIAHRLRKAVLGGARVMAVNPVDYTFRFPLADKIVTSPDGMLRALAGIAKALLASRGEQPPEGLGPLLADVDVEPAHEAIAGHLQGCGNGSVLLGNLAAAHPLQGDLQALAALIARLAGLRLGFLAEGGNSAGAWLAGAVPHRQSGGRAAATAGMDWRAMFASGLKAYLLLGVEPELDCIDSGAALKALGDAEFVVALSAYAGETMRRYADVLLPMAASPETSGTFINAEGRWQSVAACVTAPEEARPAWKVLRVMGNLFDLDGFEYLSSEEVRDELQQACEGTAPSSDIPWRNPQALPAEAPGLVRIGHFPIYAVDPLVRRAGALQRTADGGPAVIGVNAATAAKWGLQAGGQARARQGDGEVTLPLVIDEGLPDGCVLIPAGQAGTVGLGAVFDPLELSGA